MKSILIVIILALIGYSSNAQHTDRFVKLVKDLEQVSCKKDTMFYKNGTIKRVMCSTNYKYNSEKFWARTGKMIEFYKNGQIAQEYFLDNYGNLMRMKIFDRKGNKLEEYVTTEIDSNAKSLDDFFESNDHIVYKTFCQIYKYSKNSESYFLYEEGLRADTKKIGKWIKYYDNGKVKKENEF
ncbi:hypothetical protein PK35_05380 [Tamlana nanhaiensis]|uniref:Uncharacterized protein n=1 Tax=Neotamlana nanhaiensis TaxID=1382798 RepID=A0A0D7W8K7_9FLAO|nr:hypothetical protein [Tamlana nanhaiensis]KJD34157.1 hypothetical protein PK35_05380 [Tamlana nanhaiensis]